MNAQLREGNPISSAHADTTDRDLVASRPPRFFPREVRELLRSHRVHVSVRDALAILSKRASARIWEEAAADLDFFPKSTRTTEARIARYFSRAVAEPRVENDRVWIGPALALSGRCAEVSLFERWGGKQRTQAPLTTLQDQVLRMARLELRQLIAAMNGHHRPYCIHELLQADGGYVNFSANAVKAWIERRAAELASQLFAAARELALKRPRQLQRAQAVPSLGKLVLHANTRQWAMTPEYVLRARQMLCEEPLLFEWAGNASIPILDAQKALLLLPTRLAAQLHRYFDKPVRDYVTVNSYGTRDKDPVAIARDLESAIRLRAALVRAGGSVVNAGTKAGWANAVAVIRAYRLIPGAETVFADDSFVLAPLLRHAPKDLRDEFYGRLSNTLADSVAWTCFGEREDWAAPALLAMCWRQLAAFSDAIHVEIQTQTTRRKAEATQKRTFIHFMEPFVYGRYRLVDLADSAALLDEGQRMDHCSASYDIAVSHRQSRVVSIRDTLGCSLATLEIQKVDNAFVRRQLVGKHNGRASARAVEAAAALLAALNNQTHPCDPRALQPHRETYAGQPQATAGLISDNWLRERLGPWLGQRPLALMRRWGPTS